MTETIEFDAATHTYKVDGVVMPSVSKILRANGFVDDRWYTDEGRKRGQLVAMVTELDDRGELCDGQDLQALANERDVDLIGYLESWRAFCNAWLFETVYIEKPIYHPQWQYCGTPDRDILREKPAILEIKTGARQDWHALQTVAYAYCCPTFAQRFAVYLTPTDWKLVEHTNPSDESTWLGAVTIFQWKERHGYENAA